MSSSRSASCRHAHRRSAAGLCVVVLLMPAPLAAASGAGVAQSDLPTVLGIMARVAALYRDNALGFACAERITDTRYRSQNRVGRRQTHRFDYFYVFNSEEQAAASNGELQPGLQDYRTSRGGDPGVNDWYGRAWIDRETYRLLQVEAGEPGYHRVVTEVHELIRGVREQR